MTRFTRAAERTAFLMMLVGIALLVIGAIGYWVDRGGVDWYNFFDDVEAIFERRYGSYWHVIARTGLALSIIGYVVAYHYDRIIAPSLRAAARLLRWVRTGS